jgi:hypothetical protein
MGSNTERETAAGIAFIPDTTDINALKSGGVIYVQRAHDDLEEQHTSWMSFVAGVTALRREPDA